jgi:hypothetical protein
MSLDSRQNQYMPTRLSTSTDRDFAVNTIRVVEQAVGVRMDGTPLLPVHPTSKRIASGKVRGPARAKSLTA